jgi:hypothetical protein
MNPPKQTLPDFCTFLDNEKKHRFACKKKHRFACQALFFFQSKLSEGKRDRHTQKHAPLRCGRKRACSRHEAAP